MAVKKKRRGLQSKAAEIMHSINAEIGKPAIKLGAHEDFIPIKIPTGSLVIDRITGGGFTLGRSVELFGDESACKTFIALRTMALSQQRGNLCALVDPEKTFVPEWFEYLGGIPGELLLFQPEEKWNAEDAVAIMMMLGGLQAEEFIEVCTIDSVAAMVTQEEMARDPREFDQPASQARMMSRALRRITTTNKSTLFIWINQERTNIGFGAQFNPRTQSGGRALRYYATTRLELKDAGQVKAATDVADKGKLVKKDRPVGKWIQAKNVKDKSTRPGRMGMFVFDNIKHEIELESEIVTLGLEDGIIDQSGNKLTYEDVEGRAHTSANPKNFKKLLREDDELREELIASISDMTVESTRLVRSG
jgi:recombination protein RecA